MALKKSQLGIVPLTSIDYIVVAKLKRLELYELSRLYQFQVDF